MKIVEVDVLLVGCGLAGIAFCEQLLAHQQSVIVFDDASQQSSKVAAGLYNPVILKRFTPVWNADKQLSKALPLYAKIEQDLNIKFIYELPILRRFASIEEQNLWFEASDKPKLQKYLSTKVIRNTNPCIDAPYGLGHVRHCGWLDTVQLINAYKNSLIEKRILIPQQFKYEAVSFKNDAIYYGNYKAKYIVFAEGYGVKKNPYFNTLPLTGTKGEVLTIKAPQLQLKEAIKSSIFIIPKAKDIYTVGSTYNWEDKTNAPTNSAKNELLKKLKTIITCDFEVIDHAAGIRPTVKDRRPLVGQHTTHKHAFILNGLGTRGVMIAPYVAEQLYAYIMYNAPLDSEININRFFSEPI